MATYFLDTNALVKLYAFDSTSYWTIGIVASKRPRHRIVVSEIVQVELPSALYKLEHITPGIDAAQTDLALKRFAHDLRADNQFRRSRFTVMLLNASLLEPSAGALPVRQTESAAHARCASSGLRARRTGAFAGE
jgi:hypothetical protein